MDYSVVKKLGSDSCSTVWQDRGNTVSMGENYFFAFLMTISALFSVYVLVSVVLVRKVYDFYVITIPSFILSFAVMVISLYISIDFVDLEDVKDQKRFLRIDWFMSAFYGAYHWICAIQYLQSSLILKIYHLEVQNRTELI